MGRPIAGARVVRLKPRLRVVGKLIATPRIPRRELVARALKLFPKLSLRKRWVRARERLGTAEPRVEIGIERTDTSRTARSLKEAGIHLQPEMEMPHLLKKLLRLDS